MKPYFRALQLEISEHQKKIPKVSRKENSLYTTEQGSEWDHISQKQY